MLGMLEKYSKRQGPKKQGNPKNTREENSKNGMGWKIQEHQGSIPLREVLKKVFHSDALNVVIVMVKIEVIIIVVIEEVVY